MFVCKILTIKNKTDQWSPTSWSFNVRDSRPPTSQNKHESFIGIRADLGQTSCNKVLGRKPPIIDTSLGCLI